MTDCKNIGKYYISEGPPSYFARCEVFKSIRNSMPNTVHYYYKKQSNIWISIATAPSAKFAIGSEKVEQFIKSKFRICSFAQTTLNWTPERGSI